MADIQLNAGVASKYFVTDLKRGLALMERPWVLVATRQLDLEHWAEALAVVQAREAASLFGSPNPDVPATVVALTDMVHDRVPDKDLGVRTPLFILANGIQKEALASMKVLQLRCLCRIIALDGSALKFDDAATSLGPEFRSQPVFRNDVLEVSAPTRGLCVVSGFHKTVISANKNSRGIIGAFPELVMIDVATLTDEPIL
jgi:hypothetical protein